MVFIQEEVELEEPLKCSICKDKKVLEGWFLKPDEERLEELKEIFLGYVVLESVDWDNIFLCEGCYGIVKKKILTLAAK